MKKSPINVLVIRLQECFSALNINITDAELESVAVCIHDTMRGNMRQFHTIEHIFEVAEPFTEPLQVLACLFHDMVYYQVDNGFGRCTQKIMEHYIKIVDNQIVIAPQITPLPAWWGMLLEVFGFKEGDSPGIYGGINEFLSATTAMHYLQPYLSLPQLLKIAVCIEGTIPFRGFDYEGNTHFEVEEKRIFHINQQYNTGLTEEQMVDMIHSAVAIANQDVSNFANTDTADFLDNTWLLIYEANSHLNNTENTLYSIVGYREGLMKTEGFLKNLKTANIFHQYRNVPKQIEYARLTHQAQRNMAVAREYMAVKVCLATLLESLAVETGGDVPMSMMVGMVRTDADRQVQRAEDYLPPLKAEEKQPCNPKVLHLLAYGRNEDTNFDMRRAPLSAYLYEITGSAKLIELMQTAKELFAKNITHAKFLEVCHPVLVSRLAQACSQVAITRQKALEKFFIA
jgi:hypothetical protein